MRMTDERLAELDAALNEEHGRMFYAAMADELLQALKAEREKVKELEALLGTAMIYLQTSGDSFGKLGMADKIRAALEGSDAT